MLASANEIVMLLFTILHEVVCKHYAYFLGTANSRNSSVWSGQYPSYVRFSVKDLLLPIQF